MTSLTSARKISRDAGKGTGNSYQESTYFASSSPESSVVSSKPVTKAAPGETLTVLGGFALAAILLVLFLGYLMVVLG